MKASDILSMAIVKDARRRANDGVGWAGRS